MASWFQAISPEFQTAFWTIAVAIVCSVMCALLGVWLVLQRVSMLGDAISHSVLPGLVVTFILFGTRASFPMFVGAAVAGLLTVVLTRLISKASLLKQDASMGVVFTVLFALGVILITRYARQIDLDPGCVLYGLIEFVALDTFNVAGLDVPRALLTLGPALILSGAFLFSFRKELALLAFDPPLAQALGKRPDELYYALMGMVAIATVASFEAVGSILVIAMLIGPAATAQLLTRRLRAMVGLSVLAAVVSSVAGYWLAVRLNTSIAGMMSVVVGVQYAAALVFSPAGGVLHTRMELESRRRKIAEEDVLAAAYRLQESGSLATASAISGLVGAPWFREGAIRRLVKKGQLSGADSDLSLTPRGTEQARGLVRRHRLLEQYLSEELGKSASEVHGPADRSEHHLGILGEEAIEQSVREQRTDPHGRTIPPRNEQS